MVPVLFFVVAILVDYFVASAPWTIQLAITIQVKLAHAAEVSAFFAEHDTS
jgi:hypothetical protein